MKKIRRIFLEKGPFNIFNIFFLVYAIKSTVLVKFFWNLHRHYENMPIQIYRKIHLQKLKIFK